MEENKVGQDLENKMVEFIMKWKSISKNVLGVVNSDGVYSDAMPMAAQKDAKTLIGYLQTNILPKVKAGIRNNLGRSTLVFFSDEDIVLEILEINIKSETKHEDLATSNVHQ